jgi:hypothetical protein
MNAKHFVVALAATLLLAFAGSAQNSVADQLQKGIYAQETSGKLDDAILIYRQVLTAASSDGSPYAKLYAAQAQYRLVACLLLKGDRPGAEKELQTLERNFPGQPDLIKNARDLMQAGAALLPEPWGRGEAAQLNIKRDGAFTGEYLFYSVDPDSRLKGDSGESYTPNPGAMVLNWELHMKATTRSVMQRFVRETMQPSGPASLESNDELGDAAAAPLSGPAVDIEQSVFLLRRLPLAVGYKNTLKTRPFTLLSNVPGQVELSVTGIEVVETPSGKYKCYKVAFAAIGQTFWIGVEGARPLVKFQSGAVEAELVKAWGPENVLDSVMSFLPAAGWTVRNAYMGPGPTGIAEAADSDRMYGGNYGFVHVTLRKVFTPKAEIGAALRQAMAERTERYYTARPGSLQERLIGGQQALACIVDTKEKDMVSTYYYVWVRTESTAVEFRIGGSSAGNSYGQFSAVVRWRLDPVLATARIP